jgi:predicted O-methyltransferase YrrM
MSNKIIKVFDELYQYILSVSLREPDILRRLREETAPYPNAVMQISPDQGQFMALLIKLMNAKKAIELGVFTGYSSLSVALALPEDGKLIACDVSKEWTDVAKRYWVEAGVAHKIDLRLAPAMDTLDGLLEDGLADSFDFVFIDADKRNYARYFERCLKLLRRGGLIAIDNVLWGGAVADPETNDPDTEAIRKFNANLHSDNGFSLSLIPIADGLTLVLK